MLSNYYDRLYIPGDVFTILLPSFICFGCAMRAGYKLLNIDPMSSIEYRSFQACFAIETVSLLLLPILSIAKVHVFGVVHQGVGILLVILMIVSIILRHFTVYIYIIYIIY